MDQLGDLARPPTNPMLVGLGTMFLGHLEHKLLQQLQDALATVRSSELCSWRGRPAGGAPSGPHSAHPAPSQLLNGGPQWRHGASWCGGSIALVFVSFLLLMKSKFELALDKEGNYWLPLQGWYYQEWLSLSLSLSLGPYIKNIYIFHQVKFLSLVLIFIYVIKAHILMS